MSHGLCMESESSSHRLGNFGLLGDSKISYISDICEVEYRSYKVLKVISKTFLNKYIHGVSKNCSHFVLINFSASGGSKNKILDIFKLPCLH